MGENGRGDRSLDELVDDRLERWFAAPDASRALSSPQFTYRKLWATTLGFPRVVSLREAMK